MLAEGDKAADFKLKDKDGKEHSLKDIKTPYTVLYFYPKDDTPGCTLEAIDFTKRMDELKKLGATVIGISGGDEKTKRKFCERHKLKVTLLSDPGFKVSEKYGVYGEKKFMGRKYKGISRTTFILDKEKKVIRAYVNVNPIGHANEVIDFIRTRK